MKNQKENSGVKTNFKLSLKNNPIYIIHKCKVIQQFDPKGRNFDLLIIMWNILHMSVKVSISHFPCLSSRENSNYLLHRVVNPF